MFCAVNMPKSCLELYYFKDKIQHIIQCKLSLSVNFSSHFLTEVVLVLSINEVIIATGVFFSCRCNNSSRCALTPFCFCRLCLSKVCLVTSTLCCETDARLEAHWKQTRAFKGNILTLSCCAEAWQGSAVAAHRTHTNITSSHCLTASNRFDPFPFVSVLFGHLNYLYLICLFM